MDNELWRVQRANDVTGARRANGQQRVAGGRHDRCITTVVVVVVAAAAAAVTATNTTTPTTTIIILLHYITFN